jgi:hypothetical protein
MLAKPRGHQGGAGQDIDDFTQPQQGHLGLAMLLLFGPSLPGLHFPLQAP